MLRELATVLDELHDAVGGVSAQRWAERVGLRVDTLELDLPMDIVPVFKDGGCALLADVTRNYADAEWRGDRSRLHIVWQAQVFEPAP